MPIDLISIKKPLLVVLLGPTAVGKTAVSLRLAKHYQTEIVSADSRQCFKEISIGTAKPSPAELADVKHHFIGSHSIHQNMSAGLFEQEALNLLKDRFQLHKLLILVGGSGLYIDALCQGLLNPDLPAADPALRQDLDLLFAQKGIVGLQEKLQEIDQAAYKQIDIRNKQRLMRVLEICISSGKSYAWFVNSTQTKPARPFDVLKIGLTLPRELLYAQINQRVTSMLAKGLLAEVQDVCAYKQCYALQTVGYTELFDHLEKKYSLDEATRLIKQHTRNFAKRQLTWFKKDARTTWFLPNQYAEMIAHIDAHLNMLALTPTN